MLSLTSQSNSFRAVDIGHVVSLTMEIAFVRIDSFYLAGGILITVFITHVRKGGVKFIEYIHLLDYSHVLKT